MSAQIARSDAPDRRTLAALRSGRDWARWLARAHTAQPFGTPLRASGRLPAAWIALVGFARREGFAAAFGDCADGDAFTTWCDRRIHVRRDAGPGQAITALAHQLAHVLLHGQIAYLGRPGTVSCRAIGKAEAGSVAYLVAIHLGLQVSAFRFPSPFGWARLGPGADRFEIMQAVSDRILAAATGITGHLNQALGQPARGNNRVAAQPWHAHSGGIAAPHLGAGATGHHGGARQRHTAISGGVRRDGPGRVAAQPVPGTQLVRVHQAAAQFFRGRLAGSWVAGYLAGRGFGAAAQRHWQAGYAPGGWDTLTRHLRAIGYPPAAIQAAGLAHRSSRGTLIDTFRDRAVLPIRDPGGTIVAFIGRAHPGAGPAVPKYLNSPGTRLYTKHTVLFGLWEARGLLAHGAQPVIVEGPFDAIAVTAAGCGRYAGVAACGTALTPGHAAALGQVCDLRATGVAVAFDPDQAGRKAAIAAYRVLCPLTETLIAVALPAGQDPAQMLADHGPAALTQAFIENARPLADLVVDAVADGWSRWLCYPEGQFNALHAAAPVIAAMPPSHVARQVARLARRLGLDHATVTEAVTDALPPIRAGPPQAAAAGQRNSRGRHGP